MRFEQYILNENSGRSKDISFDKTKEMLHKNCSQALKAWKKNKGYIYRGSYTKIGKYGYMDSSKFKERTSANTTNEYTVLINHILDSWKQYPKRNVICSTDDNNAATYGDTYHVFPFDNTKIGVCSNFDIWSSFKNFDQLTDVNSFITDTYGNYDSVKDLEKWLKNTKIGELDGDILDDKYYRDFLNYNFDMTIYDLFNNILLNPKKNGFKLVNVGTPLPKDREVWFDGKAVMVKYWPKDIMEKLV